MLGTVPDTEKITPNKMLTGPALIGKTGEMNTELAFTTMVNDVKKERGPENK